MLNSNFDLRKFLTESNAPIEQIEEATLTEATVMEYIREKMDSMNNEVRDCMREYLSTCNEIDPSHEDAHAQLMGALEDFYNKLKAHFEEDEAPMDTPVAAAPVGTIGDEPLEEGEEDFGGEDDELEEAKVKITPPGEESYEALGGKEMSDEEADEFIEKSKNVRGITKAEKIDEITEALDPETVSLLLGLAKTAVSVGTVPAALGILYQYKDNPKIAKAIAAFERHLDK